jgi:hypothetical protein
MVGLELFFIDDCSLEEIRQFRDLPFTIRQAPQVEEDEVIIAVLSTPEFLPVLSLIDGLVGGRLLADSIAMEYVAGAMQ